MFVGHGCDTNVDVGLSIAKTLKGSKVQVVVNESDYAHLYNVTLVKDGEEVIDLKGLNGTVTLGAGQYVLKAETMLPLDVVANFTYAFSIEEELTSVSAIDSANDILTLHQSKYVNGLYFAHGKVHPDNVTVSETNTALTDKNGNEETAIYQYNVDIETRTNNDAGTYRPVIGIDFAYTAEELIALKNRGLTKFRFTFMMQGDEGTESWRLQRNMRVLSGIHETIENNSSNCIYFPAYEIVHDELRDYRFYGKDMLHLSEVAESYVFQKFINWAVSGDCQKYLAEVSKQQKFENHRPKYTKSL